jgi:hypothetical protein
MHGNIFLLSLTQEHYFNSYYVYNLKAIFEKCTLELFGTSFSITDLWNFNSY